MIAKSDAWGAEQLSRRQRMLVLPDREGYTARPEDVIVSKMQYYKEGGSEKHLRDIASMLKLSSDQIDRDYVQRWGERLDLMEIWRAILTRLQQ